jgi:hypothetical protein
LGFKIVNLDVVSNIKGRKMTQFVFEKWWNENFSNKRFASGNEELLIIESMMIEFDSEIRILIIDEFLKRDYIFFVCKLIPMFGNYSQKQQIRDKFLKWLDSRVEDSDGQDYIKCILKTYLDSDSELIKRYFSNQNSIWFNVHSELFHVDKDMFLSLIEEYLTKFDDERLFDYETLSYLIYDFEALEFLIDNLSQKQSERLKQFCITKSKRPFYGDEIKERLNRLLIR